MNRRKCNVFPITGEEKQEMAVMYSSKMMSLRAIADHFRISRQAVWKALVRLGVDTRKATGCHVSTSCHYCEKPISPTRSRFRSARNHYCDQGCYYAYVNSGDAYIPNRAAQKRGRGTIEKIYGPLPDGSVVHHRDKNTFNNDPGNLMLFASHADHLRWHRGIRDGIVPLWSG